MSTFVSVQQLEKVITAINNDIFESTNGKEYLNLVFKTDGNVIIVDFIDIQIWNSEDDERLYDVDGDDEPEHIESYLRKTIRKEIMKINAIKV